MRPFCSLMAGLSAGMATGDLVRGATCCALATGLISVGFLVCAAICPRR